MKPENISPPVVSASSPYSVAASASAFSCNMMTVLASKSAAGVIEAGPCWRLMSWYCLSFQLTMFLGGKIGKPNRFWKIKILLNGLVFGSRNSSTRAMMVCLDIMQIGLRVSKTT